MQFSGLKSCFKLLDARQRREYWLVAILSTLASLMEMIGIAAIIPVITVLVDYQGAVSNSHLQWAYHIFGEPSQRMFLVLLAFSAIATVWFSGIISLLSIYANQRYLKRINADLSVRVYQQYMSYSIEDFYRRPSSEFMRNVHGISERVTNGVLGASIAVIARLIQIIVVTIVLFFVNFKVTSIILLVIFGAYAAIFMFVRNRIERMSIENLFEGRILQQLIIGSYQAYRNIVIDQQLGAFVSHFRNLKKATSRKAADIAIIGSVPRQLIEIVGVTLLIVASYLVGRTTENGHQFVTMMALFGIAAYRLLPSGQQLYNALNRIIAALAVYRVVADEWGNLRTPVTSHLTDITKDNKLTQNKKPLMLEVKSISYAFGSKKLFNRLSLTIPLSGVIRIAGNSGVGKSTFIEILAGLRQPQEGNILLDGTLLIGCRRRQWWSQISYVSQTDYVYEGTIRKNVILDRSFNKDRFNIVSDICGLDTLARNGLYNADQDINEAGTNLSGGQKSRLLLARALYKFSEIIILDEVFSALDIDSARMILSRVRAEFPQRCLVVVSHREAELTKPFHTVLLTQ